MRNRNQCRDPERLLPLPGTPGRGLGRGAAATRGVSQPDGAGLRPVPSPLPPPPSTGEREWRARAIGILLLLGLPARFGFAAEPAQPAGSQPLPLTRAIPPQMRAGIGPVVRPGTGRAV